MNITFDRAARGSAEANSRWPAINALKGFAILLVIVYHAGSVLGVANVIRGESGVDIFLLLSGLLLATSSHQIAWDAFLRRRFFRIFPAYWIAVAVFTWGGVVLLQREFTLSDILQHVLGVHATVRGAYFSDLNDSFWFISTIITLYLIFLVVRRWINDAGFVLGLAGLTTLLALIPAPGFAHLAPRLPAFFIGIIVGEILRSGRFAFHPGTILLLGSATAVILGWGRGLNYLYLLTALGVTAAFVSLDKFLRRTSAGRRALHPFEWVGLYSFEIYLFHQPLIRDYNLWFQREVLCLEPGRNELLAGFAVGLILTGLIAVSVHRLVATACAAAQSGSSRRQTTAILLLGVAPLFAMAGSQWAAALSPPVQTFVAKQAKRWAQHPPQNARFDGWSGPVQFEIQLPATFGSTAYPLIVTGKTGAGDLLGLRRLDENHIQLVLDHWGVGTLESAPITLAPRARHLVTVSLGSLLPPPTAGFYGTHPQLRPLTRQIFVAFDHQTVWEDEVDFHSSAPSDATLGCNTIGGSLVTPRYPTRLRNPVTADPTLMIGRAQKKT